MLRRLILLLACLAGLAAAPAAARTTITPYLEVEQVFSADLSGHGDAVTYTGVGGGVDVVVDGPRLKAQVDYRYDHYFAWNHGYGDTDEHTGIARADYSLTPELTLEGAAFGTRAHGSLATPAPGLLVGDFNNTEQVYGFQAGPSYAGRFGDLSVKADYRYSWVHAGSPDNSLDLGPGQPVLDSDFTTDSHVVDASIGMGPGELPFGWTVSGGYIRDQIHFLDARYTGTFGRADVIVPVSPSVALEGGVGYETNRAGQDQILVDADGNAVLGPNRRLQPDRSKPRLLSYDQNGLIWDVGVMWRPDERTSLEVRGGRRYGETTVTGSFTYRISPTASFQAVAYDDIESFGRQLSSAIGSLPTSFASPIVNVGGGLQGCVFGTNGGKGTCLPALASVTSDFYRARGGYALLSAQRGLWTYGLGVGYMRRHYLTMQGGEIASLIAPADDQSVTGDLLVSRRLSPVSSLSGQADIIWIDTGLPSIGSYTTYGVTGTYDREFSRRLSGTASIGIYSGSGGTVNQDVIGTALVALRYQL